MKKTWGKVRTNSSCNDYPFRPVERHKNRWNPRIHKQIPDNDQYGMYNFEKFFIYFVNFWFVQRIGFTDFSSDFGEFVYFLNFPGLISLSRKIQSVQFAAQFFGELVYFLNFPGIFAKKFYLLNCLSFELSRKIQSFEFSLLSSQILVRLLLDVCRKIQKFQFSGEFIYFLKFPGKFRIFANKFFFVYIPGKAFWWKFSRIFNLRFFNSRPRILDNQP